MKSGFKRTEVGVIPENWDVYTLGYIGEVRMCKRIFKHQTRGLGDVPFYKIGTFGDVPDAFISQALFDEFRRKYSFPHTGDVLISAAGTVGRTVVYDGTPAYFQDSNIVWIDNDQSKATNEYLWHYYQVIKWTISDGGTVARLYNDNLKNKIYVAVPPPPEQRAIAEALGDADALIESLERLIAKKRDLKQGAMQELLTARRRLPGFTGKWETKTLGKLAAIQRGASPRPIDSPIWFDANSTVGWVRISDVAPSGMYLFDTSQKLSELGIQHSRPVGRGSLIMSICATVGRPVITAIDTCLHDGFVVFDSPQADIRFLYYLLKSIEDTWSKHGQTGSQMNLNTPLINGTAVYLPSKKEEQAAIAAVLSEMDAEIAALEEKQGKARTIKQGMMQELLTGRIRLV